MSRLQAYEDVAAWLEDQGWKRVRFNPDGQSSKFSDPFNPDRLLWAHDAIEEQKARLLEVPEVMES